MWTIRLTAVEAEHHRLLREWRNSDDFRRFCSVNRRILTELEFEEERQWLFLTGLHWQCLIRGKNDVPIGTVCSYDYSKRDGHCFVTLYVAREYRTSGAGVIASILFATTLFEELGLYKVYVDVNGHNTRVIDMLRRAGLSEEGVFKGHRVIEGERYDVFRFALYQECLTVLAKKYVKE